MKKNNTKPNKSQKDNGTIKGNIKGDPDEKIAVIGGGLSGLLIAEGLQKKGYKNITVFESGDRLGGKLHTVWYKGRSYEIGAVFGLPAQKYMKAFMKTYNIKADGPKLARIYYDRDGHKIMQIPKGTLGDFVVELDRLPDVLATHKSLENDNLLGLEPALTIPFSMWCDLYHFTILKNVYAHYFTSYGLGDIEILPAIYVLKIMNYDNLMSFMELPEFCTWKEGVSTLVKCLEGEIHDIRLSQKVTDIITTEHGKVHVQTEFESLIYDRVILAAPLNQFSKIYKDDEKMQSFLSSIKYQNYSVYLFIAENVPTGCGCVLENLTAEKRGHLVLWNARWEPVDGESLITVYAYDPPCDNKELSYRMIEEDLLKLGIQNPRLYHYKRWQQCPYVESEVLQEGFYDKLEAMQGQNNLYLAGEIISTVSMENCFRYSNYFINRYF